MIREITSFFMQTHVNEGRKEVKKIVSKVEKITRESSDYFMVLSRQLQTNYLLKSSGNSFGTNWRIYCSFQQCMIKIWQSMPGGAFSQTHSAQKESSSGPRKKDHQAWWQFRPENLQITDCLNTVHLWKDLHPTQPLLANMAKKVTDNTNLCPFFQEMMTEEE